MNHEILDSLGEAALRQMARQVGLRGAMVLDVDLLRVGLRAYLSTRPEEEEEAAAEVAEAEVAGGVDPAVEARRGGGAGAAGVAFEGGRGGVEAVDTALPPALRTETMARVLERQGRVDVAARVRASLTGREPEASPSSAIVMRPRVSAEAPLGENGRDSVGRKVALWMERAAAGGLVLRYRVSGGPDRSDSADLPRLVLEWALTFAGGGRRSRRISLGVGGVGSGDLEEDLPLPRSEDAVVAVAAILERPAEGPARPLARTPLQRPGDAGGGSS